MTEATNGARPPPKQSTPFGRLPRLTTSQADEYLLRIGLNHEETRAKPLNYRTLAELQLAHLLTVPFDNTLMHISEQDFTLSSSTKNVTMMSGPGIACTIMAAFHAIVQQRRGGYCFVNNTLFSALLRHLGFRVSEVAARVNSAYNQDPNEVGYQWRGLSHMCLLVDIEGERYLVDVGFGGGSPEYPAPLKKTSHIRSFVDGEAFELRKEFLPGADEEAFVDAQEGWTLYRQFGAREGRESFESPCYHVIEQSLVAADWEILNFYNSQAPDAAFSRRCVVSRLRPDGTRDVFTYFEGDDEARWVLRAGNLGNVLEEERMKPCVSNILEVLRRKFGLPMRPRTMSRIASA